MNPTPSLLENVLNIWTYHGHLGGVGTKRDVVVAAWEGTAAILKGGVVVSDIECVFENGLVVLSGILLS